MKLIGEVDFNREDDKEEFGAGTKVIRVNRWAEDGKHRVGFSFELGRKDDDTLNLTFELAELVTVVSLCEED